MGPRITATSGILRQQGQGVATAGADQIPDRMTAIAITAPGGPDVLQPVETAIPRPGPGQVLIEVAYAGVNRPDVLQRLGHYPPPPGASALPGLEVSGTIVAVGEGVDAGLLGRAVCALVTGGGYAEYCLACADHCLPVPAGLTMAEAAALPETLFTVWHNVFERGWACEGEALLVHGGTSGIGTMAITLAKLFGLTVIVTCGSDGKCDAALAHGADHAINYRTADFGEQVLSITGGKGVELVLDMVAGSYTQRNLDCLAESGRLVTIAVLGGAKAEINMAKLMVRRQTITGSTMRGRSDAFKALLADEIERTVWPLVADGSLRPMMDRIFPLAEAGAAQARMEAGDHLGKIVLEVGKRRDEV
jgi:putative PIG3 family NAD(P)H quinone oxidoreductase